jgi:hypothetical protein
VPVNDAWAKGRTSIHRSKAWVPWGLLAMGLACGTKNEPRIVSLYTPKACLVAPSAKATYLATGDFSPPYEQSISLASVGESLSSLPSNAESMLVEAEAFEGVSLIDPTGPVDVLVLPNEHACQLSENVNPPLAGTRPGATFGLVDVHHALLVGGGSPNDAPSLIDLGRGAVERVSPTLEVPRNLASVTPFGTGALVAGGESPPGSTSEGQSSTAEIYQSAPDGGVGGFTEAPVILVGGARANHGAVVLATGETLLVGGTDGAHALTSLEYVRPGAPTSVRLSLTLSTGRVGPVVFWLPTGKIFVGGGFREDGTPVQSVEWLDGDHLIDGTSSVIPPVPLCMGAMVQGFAPLEGGAVLAVFGAAPPANCSNVLVIRPDFTVDQAPSLSPPPLAPLLLFPGASSSPVLLTADRAQRWNPWSGAWDPPLGPGAVPTESEPTTALLSADPGLGIWLGSDAHVWGLRFDTRNAYATDPPTAPPLLLDGTAETAPDRLLPSSDIQFTPEEGLKLSNGAGVFITDATYADADIDFTAAEGPFRLILRDNDTGLEFEVGKEGSCFTDELPMDTSMRVVRQGATLSAGIVGTSPFMSCVIPAWLETARIAVGFRGPLTGASTINTVTVKRTGSP